MSGRRWARVLGALFIALALTGTTVVGAWAEGEGNIDHAETKEGVLRVLYSVPELEEGVEPDLSTLQVTVNGTQLKAEAELAADVDASEQVRRTTILAIDTSRSMRGERFEQAQEAAKAFLEGAPTDLYVGIVGFAGSVDVLQRPTLDREAAAAVLDGLTLTLQTRLYEGVIAATKAAGSQGQRTLLVLSDGRDTTETDLQEVIDTIAGAKVRVDVVALGDEATQANAPLEAMASQGNGEVIAAADPDALTALFEREAAELSRQMLVTAPLPDEFSDVEGSVAVSVDAGGETYSDSAFVSFGVIDDKPSEQEVAGPRTVEVPSLLTSTNALLAGLGALGVGLLVVLLGAFGVLGRRDKGSVEDQIAAYTRAGSGRRAGAGARGMGPGAPSSSRSVTQSAVGMAEKALEGNSALESKLGGKLESAGISLKPAEWLLTHSGIAFGAALFGFLLSGGGIVLALVLLLAGAVLPWMYLGIRKSRRQKAFNSQLAETLQLISGSLSAGLSLSQSLDTVVREGSEPITSEFRRALVEARLGIPVEDTLDNVAKRMESADFEWVVMAIRIQREVGGNLAELLLKVAGTMRERDYLRRQVKTLSAEGKMSAYILGALPPGMFAYMLMANRDYVSPLYTTPLGWFMLVSAAMLMAVGAFWMSRLVKVDV
jgi:tight adherence protein B